MQYVSYLRVSTQRQGQSGLGLEAQRAAVQQYLTQRGGTFVQEFVEVESGSRKARPILVQSIALCRRSKAVLLIAKLDRLARNVAFISSIMESGVEFVAVDAPYANRLMIHILAAFAEHERSLISERTRAALAAARERGTALGENGKRLAAENKRAAVDFAESLRAAVDAAALTGPQTLSGLSAALNAAGHCTREGKLWRPGTTARLLRRLHRDNQHPALMTVETEAAKLCA